MEEVSLQEGNVSQQNRRSGLDERAEEGKSWRGRGHGNVCTGERKKSGERKNKEEDEKIMKKERILS